MYICIYVFLFRVVMCEIVFLWFMCMFINHLNIFRKTERKKKLEKNPRNIEKGFVFLQKGIEEDS